MSPDNLSRDKRINKSLSLIYSYLILKAYKNPWNKLNNNIDVTLAREKNKLRVMYTLA